MGGTTESALPYYFFYIIPIVGYLSLTTLGIWSYGGMIFAFVAVPILDLIVPEDVTNPTKEQSRRLSQAFRFKIIPVLYMPTQMWLILFGCTKVMSNDISLFEQIGVTLTVGAVGGVGINVAHELIHKSTVWERTVARILLWSVGYGHWGVEHVRGHHKLVSTLLDPASSRAGESFYSFWYRSVTGTWKSSRAIESWRLRKASAFTKIVDDETNLGIAMTVAMATVLMTWYGASILPYFIFQGLVAFTLLEAVNYVEHYGLQRKLRPNAPPLEKLRAYLEKTGDVASVAKHFETVTPFHSWNAGEALTNFLLLKLQRHSDHHAHGGRRYQVLRSFIAAPQLPTGYSGCMLMSLIPPLWFSVMNPRVKAADERRIAAKHAGVDVFSESFDTLARKQGSVLQALEIEKKKVDSSPDIAKNS